MVSDDTPARFASPCAHMRMRGETEAGQISSIVETSLSWQLEHWAHGRYHAPPRFAPSEN